MHQIIWALMILPMIAIPTFKSDRYTISPDDKEILWVHKTWWGLKEVGREVKWSGSGWRAKSKSGEWYIFFADYDEPEVDDPIPGR